jgi:hypothetical protein
MASLLSAPAGSPGVTIHHGSPRRSQPKESADSREQRLFFDGAIGDVAVYDYALSSMQIASTFLSMFARAG